MKDRSPTTLTTDSDIHDQRRNHIDSVLIITLHTRSSLDGLNEIAEPDRIIIESSDTFNGFRMLTACAGPASTMRRTRSTDSCCLGPRPMKSLTNRACRSDGAKHHLFVCTQMAKQSFKSIGVSVNVSDDVVVHSKFLVSTG